MLDLHDVSVHFGGLKALDRVSFGIGKGSIHALIGPNGAGKTTLFNVISGVQKLTSGRVVFDGRDVSALPLFRRASFGMARTFQNIRLFAGMTVLENVMCGAHSRLGVNPLLSILNVGAGAKEERECREECLRLLAFVGLEGDAYTAATSLSYGHQRRVEIARALASRPRLLLLDEPAAGMNPTETHDLAQLLKNLQNQGLTLVVVEHDLQFLMKLSDRMTVLNFGRLLSEGAPLVVRNDPHVIEAYLGSSAAERMKVSA
jgi:branched-chain amino acid transport system ATP-binding protein